jgi:hypothetical protein
MKANEAKSLTKGIEGFAERIGACALLWHAESIEHAIKAETIAEARNVSIDDACRIYITGALKCAIRRGSAKTIRDALETLEYEQVTDRGLSVKGFTNNVNKEVKRLEKMTGDNYTRIVGGKAVVVELGDKPESKPHTKNMGKVLGTLYVEYDAKAASTEPEYMLEYAGMEAAAIDIDSAIGAYIGDYVARLSVTARKAIRDIVASTLSTDDIMRGKDNKLLQRAKYLHHNFPKADAITTRELVGLLRQYSA